MRHRHALTLVAVGLLVLCGAGPSSRPGVSQPLKHGVVRVGDVLRVALLLPSLGDPDLKHTYDVRVRRDGTIWLPLVEDVKVEGLTTDQAAKAAADNYREVNLTDRGVVTVGVLRRFEGSPGSQPLAIADHLRIEVGGLTDSGGEATVQATVAANGTIELPLAGALKVVGLNEVEVEEAATKLYAEKPAERNVRVVAQRVDADGNP